MKKGHGDGQRTSHIFSEANVTGENSSPVETFLIDSDGILTYSKGFDLTSFGHHPGPSSGLSVFDLFRDDPDLLAVIKRALDGEQIIDEVSVEDRVFSTTYSPVFDLNGRVQNVIGVSYDITDSKHAREILKKSEFRLRTLFNSAHDAIFIFSISNGFVDCNDATMRIFQCTKEDIIGQRPERFSPPTQPDGRASPDLVAERVNAAFNGHPQFFEWRHIRFDGTPFDAEVSLNRLDLKDEIQIQAIVRDVSERKKAEEEHRRLAMVVNTTTNMVILSDGEGRIEWVNPAFTRNTGYTLAEIRGKKPGSFLRGPETDADVVKFMRAMTRQGKGFKDVEIINYNKDGTPYWVSIEVQPLLDSTGKVIQFIAVQSDISERKAIQQALLVRNDDLLKINTELDRFVYSASHDLRAPIASLLGLIEVARLEKNRDSLEQLLNLQKKTLLRLDHFIRDIVDHSRNTRLKVESEPVNFESIVNGVFEQLQFMDNVSKIRRSITISQDGAFHTALTRLEIILKNLISNAIKYADLRKEDPAMEVAVTSNANVAVIYVRDNGEGIPTDARPRIFEMFYRASANGSGSGLGLYIVKEAVQKIGGTITVHSEYGKGTEFVVTIPNLTQTESPA
jgi:PAS domain S-box-containing protein